VRKPHEKEDIMVKRGLLVAAAIFFVGTSVASACPVEGRVVCAGTGTGIGDVGVMFSQGSQLVDTTVTDADGYFYAGVWGTTLDVTLDVNGTLIPEPQIVCGDDGALISIPPYQISCGGEPPPPPPTTADCSPGYYKNHPSTWCTAQCGFTDPNACTAVVRDLSATGPGSADIREAAKTMLDACFVTAEASPCADD
jgi:hypothetical protein